MSNDILKLGAYIFLFLFVFWISCYPILPIIINTFPVMFLPFGVLGYLAGVSYFFYWLWHKCGLADYFEI